MRPKPAYSFPFRPLPCLPPSLSFSPRCPSRSFVVVVVIVVVTVINVQRSESEHNKSSFPGVPLSISPANCRRPRGFAFQRKFANGKIVKRSPAGSGRAMVTTADPRLGFPETADDRTVEMNYRLDEKMHLSPPANCRTRSFTATKRGKENEQTDERDFRDRGDI